MTDNRTAQQATEDPERRTYDDSLFLFLLALSAPLKASKVLVLFYTLACIMMAFFEEGGFDLEDWGPGKQDPWRRFRKEFVACGDQCLQCTILRDNSRKVYDLIVQQRMP